MKFIIFNVVVAGALVYLVANDDMSLPSNPQEAASNAEANLTETMDKIRPQVEETASRVAEKVATEMADKIAEQVARQLAEQQQTSAIEASTPLEAAPQPAQPEQMTRPAAPQMDPATLAMLDPEETLYEDPAAAGTQATATAEPTAEPFPVEEKQVAELPTQNFELGKENYDFPGEENVSAQATGDQDGDIQLAEGEKLMSARDRKRELDLLAQNMEMMFLTKTGE